MAFLSVNLDSVAALREIKKVGEPEPCQAAVLAELGGTDGISVQFQRNRKNVRERDLYLLKGIVKTRLTIEMPPVDELVDKACEIKPYMITFVAEQVNIDLSAETIDFAGVALDFRSMTSHLSGLGIAAGFFVEPDTEAIKGASKAGASAVTINAAHYADARTIGDAQKELDRIDSAAQTAAKAELTVMCGRGLNYKNIGPLAEISAIDEFVIGNAVCARAMLIGFERAVKEMIAAIAAK